MFADCSEKRPAGLIRVDLIRRMMNPLDEYPDLFKRVTTSPYRQLMLAMDRPPAVSPGPLRPSLETGWNFG